MSSREVQVPQVPWASSEPTPTLKTLSTMKKSLHYGVQSDNPRLTKMLGEGTMLYVICHSFGFGLHFTPQAKMRDVI